MSWLLFLGSVMLITLIRKKVNLSSTAGSIAVDIVLGLLVSVAGVNFFQIWPGQMLSQLFAGLLGWFGVPVPAAAAILTLAATIVFFADVKDKRLDKPALAALFLVPGLILLFGGPLAAFWASLYTGAQGIATNGLSGIGG